jgi:RNA polymerase sigma-70 factor (ECF subfamily)
VSAGAAPQVGELVDHLFRHSAGRMIAGLTRVFGPGRLELAEDVVQEALVRALKTWPFRGVPDDPEAWLVRVAHNTALDALRRHKLARDKEAEVAGWAGRVLEASAGETRGREELADDSLRMVFTCCHPALGHEAQIALTLKTLGGFSVPEIARALLAKEATVAQRLVRSKARLAQTDVRFEVPAPSELGARLGAVLDVIYLMFNEGYAAHSGDALVRRDLLQEAMRLAALLLEQAATRRPEVHALYALMLFLVARVPARTDEAGDLLTLAVQDRRRWDRAAIGRGFHELGQSIAGGRLTPFHVEAAIASCHAAAPDYASTDWATILERYDQLRALIDSPVVDLNRAVAVAKVHGIDAGLAELERAARHPALGRYHLLPATRGMLLWTKGDCAEAAVEFATAAKLATNEPERRLLSRRAAEARAGRTAPAF